MGAFVFYQNPLSLSRNVNCSHFVLPDPSPYQRGVFYLLLIFLLCKFATMNKKAQGRPKLNLDLPKGWQEKILTEYRKGASDEEIKGMIHNMRGSFCNDTWDRWLKEEPIFSETIKTGRMLSHAWWMATGRKGTIIVKGAPVVNTALWFINMKNRFGWRDKVEFSGDRDSPIEVVIKNAPKDGQVTKK